MGPLIVVGRGEVGRKAILTRGGVLLRKEVSSKGVVVVVVEDIYSYPI